MVAPFGLVFGDSIAVVVLLLSVFVTVEVDLTGSFLRAPPRRCPRCVCAVAV